MITRWRQELVAKGLVQAESLADWREQFDAEYQTDKPDFAGYGAVQLWAAYAENPEIPRPEEYNRQEWPKDPAFLAVINNGSTRFSQILGPELWLPIESGIVFEAAEAFGNVCKMGSVTHLAKQMRELNRRTWGAPDDTVRSWRQQELDETSLESMARWGFSIWFCLAEYANRCRLPMRLDY